jgi:lipopolysaccharide/colanic/teichoic acid biosynthesis glycosyltransferase
MLGFYGRLAKPVLDRLGGLVLTIATAPIVLVVVITLLASIGRPAIFRQERIGLNGSIFRIFKFRTMLPDQRNGGTGYHGPDRRHRHKTNGDPRHTKVGLFLRKWSLDEIPQFWNVALGQMSLVGPRPELVEIVQTKYEPWQHQRHLVKPGITGLWQVSARSDETLMYEHTGIDLEYVQNITFLKDAKILLRTVPAALGFRKGS